MTPSNARDVLSGDWSDHDAPLDDCHMCQRFQPLVWHCLTETTHDRAHCRRTPGEGLWVCALCEEAIHLWMRQHPGHDAGWQAVTALLERLTQRVLAPRRKYRKQSEGHDE